MCPVCGEPVDGCLCRTGLQIAPAGDGFVRVGRETKGRKGAGVTVVTGASGDLASLCTRLKKRCGAGGTVKDGAIEIQGDHRDAIVAELTKDGLRVKRVGG
jgi:translation initiation factor 1